MLWNKNTKLLKISRLSMTVVSVLVNAVGALKLLEHIETPMIIVEAACYDGDPVMEYCQ